MQIKLAYRAAYVTTFTNSDTCPTGNTLGVAGRVIVLDDDDDDADDDTADGT